VTGLPAALRLIGDALALAPGATTVDPHAPVRPTDGLGT
jgi:hypothetical protein